MYFSQFYFFKSTIMEVKEPELALKDEIAYSIFVNFDGVSDNLVMC